MDVTGTVGGGGGQEGGQFPEPQCVRRMSPIGGIGQFGDYLEFQRSSSLHKNVCQAGIRLLKAEVVSA